MSSLIDYCVILLFGGLGNALGTLSGLHTGRDLFSGKGLFCSGVMWPGRFLVFV